MRMTVKISTYDVLRLQLESGCSPHTIYRYLSGVPVRPVSARRILSAAQRLGIKIENPTE